MDPFQENVLVSRRQALASWAVGIGGLALTSTLLDDGVLAYASESDSILGLTNPLAPRMPHFAPKAKNCIFLFMEGAPSQIDLFDPKPKLSELHGQKLPESMTKNVRFAFIQKDSATLLGSPRKFQPHGESGMELSDYLPHLSTCADDICLIRSMHTEAFNHHPGQLLMNTGFMTFGCPTMGAWLTYGLGTEAQDLPGYVVLTSGRGTSGGASNWTSGFLPSSYQGVLFRNQGEAVLHLNNPAGVSRAVQRRDLDAVREMNQLHQAAVGDPEIAARIGSYELAFRMQAAAPNLLDFSSESQATLDMYGVNREEGDFKQYRNGGTDEFRSYSTNCLLARRLIERGVRFINIYHASWDHHSDLDPSLGFNCKMADQPIAALLKDLKQRGLLDSTLVVWAAEFGRTPLGENRVGRPSNTGRDHHPFAFSIWCAGGGIKGGQVIGKTDEIGWNVADEPIHINDFHATLLRLFGFDHLKLTYRFQGRDFRLTNVAGDIVPKMLA